MDLWGPRLVLIDDAIRRPHQNIDYKEITCMEITINKVLPFDILTLYE